ncbi:MAG: hypothetical protein A3I05_09395 [Deltaproteobacteria bacterium RIFCSPLOWO2_02_FULL_44_10]|nr:MAG: hypothetical protein A3C46_07585 [Deltaproteobacteria bacterium RIFCSPHIGHO2_02_FULL_44_16]OGQ47426.1 MAG: hypothetical protein A3I05_09395 [Deltaproteobacteria bacterium RIFCSPLOWO2_02_FULL_44_10]
MTDVKIKMWRQRLQRFFKIVVAVASLLMVIPWFNYLDDGGLDFVFKSLRTEDIVFSFQEEYEHVEDSGSELNHEFFPPQHWLIFHEILRLKSDARDVIYKYFGVNENIIRAAKDDARVQAVVEEEIDRLMWVHPGQREETVKSVLAHVQKENPDLRVKIYRKEYKRILDGIIFLLLLILAAPAIYALTFLVYNQCLVRVFGYVAHGKWKG